MDAEPLARIECDPAILAAIIEAAALRSGTDDAHDVMFSRLYPDRIDSPASSPNATQASYCTGHASQFESVELFVDPPVDVMFDIDRALAVLSWLEDAAGTMTLTFEGDPAGGVVARMVHEVTDATVVLPAETDWVLGELSLALPDRFRDGQFLGADGDPVPTRASLDTAALERLVRGADLADGRNGYTVRIGGGEVGIATGREGGATVDATAPADVSGPTVTRRVAQGLARVATSIEGGVELQTGPDEPLAIVKDRDHFALRFVVYQV